MTPVFQLVTALGMVIGLGYVLYRPQWAVLAIIVMFPLEQLCTAYFPVLNQSSSMFNVGVGGLAVLALLSKLSRGSNPLLGFKNPMLGLILGLYAIAVVSILWSPAPEVVISRVRAGVPYYVLYLLLLPLLITDLQEFRRVMTGVMIVGSVIAVLIMLNPASKYYSGRLNLDLGMYAGEARSNPLALAEMGALMALAGALMTNARQSTLMNLVRVAAVIIGLGLAIGSGSRGQVLAALLTGIAFYPVARRLNNTKQFFVVTIGFMFTVGVFFITFKLFVSDQNVERWAVTSMFRDMGGRLGFVWDLTSAWLQSPGHWLFGLGAGGFADIYGGGAYVHNMAAEVLCEEGLVGGAILVAMLLLTVKNGKRLISFYRDEPEMRSAAAVLFAACVYTLLLSLKQGSFLVYPAALYWWLLLAKVARYEALVEHEKSAHEPAFDDDEAPGYEFEGEYGDEEGLLAPR